MKIRIYPRALLQYLLVYFLLIMNQSVIQNTFLIKYSGIIIGILILPMFFKKKYRNQYVLGYVFFLLLVCILLRYVVGGVGLSAWEGWTIYILATYFVIKYNGKNFFDKYLRVVVILAFVSIICFILSLVDSELLKNLLVFQYDSKTVLREYLNVSDYINRYYVVYGGPFYVLHTAHLSRNCGIYTEPGIYQMVLNSALYILLFLEDYLSIDKKKKSKYFIILVIALLTTQSTTGYLGIAMIILFYLINRTKNNSKIKNRIIVIVCVGIVVVACNYKLSGNQSFIYTSLIGKLTNTSGSLSLNATSGNARIGTILICLATMLEHPLGVGYNQIDALIDTESTGYLAAEIFRAGAACGVLTFVLMLAWIFYPVLNSNLNRKTKVLYILLYLNTALAQSSEFYPALIIIPIYFCIFKMLDSKKRSK